MTKRSKKNILLVANWKSDVGFAWWLMENFWVQISLLADSSCKRAYLIYPELLNLPDSISSSSIVCEEIDYNDSSLLGNLRILAFIKRNNIDCIYLTDKPYLSFRYVLFRLFGVRKIIIHDHTPGNRDVPRYIKRIVKKMLNSLPAITADAVVAVTKFVRDRHLYSSCIPASKICVAQNGIVPISRSPKLINYAHAEFNIEADAKIVFTSGRASTYKGIDFIIECANFLINKRRLNKIYFLYCGDGPDIDYFKSLSAGYGLGERFVFAGVRNDVRELAQSCHIGIQASVGEVGYSLSILEYMSAGLATVVPDNPSVCSAITDGVDGLVFKEMNVISACEAIEKVIYDDELRKKLSLNAQSIIETEYNLKNTNRDFFTILKKHI
ncbi:MAG: glycosyltransferase family 4 protein [Alteromonadaceae bacterium]|nr:glycosyltransferase family 4 protein [Alteromonadaceae bacterium]